MPSRITRYNPLPKQYMDIEYTDKGEAKLSDDELAKHDNLTINVNCKCGFPLEVPLKRNGERLFKVGDEIKVECFLCKEVHTLTSKPF